MTRKSFRRAVGAAMVVALSVVLGFGGGCKLKKTAPASMPPANEPAGPLKAHSGAAGVKVSFPDNWSVNENTDKSQVVGGDARLYTTVRVECYGDMSALATDGPSFFKKVQEIEAKHKDPKYNLHDHPDAAREITVGGEKAVRVVYREPTNVMDEIHVMHAGIGYSIVMQCGQGAYDLRAPTFEAILNSIEFDPATVPVKAVAPAAP